MLADVECDCNGHRALLNLGGFFLMFNIAHFGVCCCQEELRWAVRFLRQMCYVFYQDFAYLMHYLVLDVASKGYLLQSGYME